MLSDEEKREYEELKSLLYTGTISQYGKRKLIDIIEKQEKKIQDFKWKENQQKDLLKYKTDEIEKQQKEIEELKEENKEIREWKYVIDNPIDLKKLSELDIIKIFGKSYIAKDLIKAKIEELEIEQESNREDLKIAIDNLLVQNIDKIANKISINMSIRGILQSLLEKE